MASPSPWSSSITSSLDHKNPLYPNNPELLASLQHLCQSFEYIRIPLFTVISGFVYAMRPAVALGTVEFVRGKTRRLIVPFLFVTTLVVLLQSVVQGAGARSFLAMLGYCLINPIAQLWYLPAIFLCILTVGAVDILGWMKSTRAWLFWLAVASLVELVYFRFHHFGVSHVPVDIGYVLLLPFFTLGCGLNRFQSAAKNRGLVWCCAIAVALGLLYQQLLLTGVLQGNVGKETPAGLIVGFAGTTLLILFRPTIGWLAKLGNYSFTIYLYHYLFISIMLRVPFPDGGTGHAQLFARGSADYSCPSCWSGPSNVIESPGESVLACASPPFHVKEKAVDLQRWCVASISIVIPVRYWSSEK
ncbi:MAG: acyltransferase [Planctomycetota bacterium]